MTRFIGLWPNKCARCSAEDITVNMRTVTIGISSWLLCKACSKKYDQIRSVMSVKFQAFLRQG